MTRREERDPDPNERHGYKPGDVPTGHPWPRDLWLVLPPPPQPPAVGRLARDLRTAAAAAGISNLSEVVAHRQREAGREPFLVLSAVDVCRLYRRAHRARVAVVALAGARVQRDASERASRTGSEPLESFMQHKVLYRLATRPVEVPTILRDMSTWYSCTQCEGQNDPRCLPRQVYRDESGLPLNSVEERRVWEAAQRKGAVAKATHARIDGHGRVWQRGEYHTLDLLQVAGATLPVGMHWDVQFTRQDRVSTGWETWTFGLRTYGNIHPDAYVRGKQGSKIYDALASHALARPGLTPRHSRRRGAGR